ncbi:unnamed protein product [Rhodiola kirilowii]
MDFDDLDEAAPKTAVRKFLPKPKGKAQTKNPVTAGKPESVVKHETVLKPKAEPLEEDKKAVSSGQEKSDVNGSSGVEAEVESMEIDDDDDYVVREIDVFFNPQIDENTQLYLVQYPLRPSYRPYDLDQCLKEVRVKPKSAKVEMDIEVEVGSKSHYDSFSDVNTIPQTLTSSGNILQKAGYAVGVLKGDKLYLNPINAVVQLRPSTGADDDDEEEREDTDDTKTLVNIDQKQPTALSKKQGKTIPSSTSAQNINNKESWVPLKYHSSKSDVSENYLQKLTTANHSPMPLPTLSPGDYLNAICPRRPNDNVRQGRLSMRSLMSLTLEERLKKWLCEGGEPAYRFSVLKYLAPEDPAENIIEFLKQLAVLVQGVWVPRSSILQLGSNKDALARDYLILKFSQKLTITNEELRFKKDMSLSLRAALTNLAIQRVDLNDWKFKSPADPSFLKLYPSVALQQRQLLEGRESGIMTQMNGFRESSSKFVTISTSRTANSAPTKKVLVPIEKRDALLKALAVLFKDHSVNSLETICRGLRDMAVSASSLQRTGDHNWMVVAASCIDARDELESVIGDFTTKIHDVYVAKSSLIHPELNSLRDVVIKLFLAQPVNGKLKKANILDAFKADLNQDITNNDYLKVMNEFCITSGSAWVLKSPGR